MLLSPQSTARLFSGLKGRIFCRENQSKTTGSGITNSDNFGKVNARVSPYFSTKKVRILSVIPQRSVCKTDNIN